MTVPGQNRNFLSGFWKLADPKISLASFAALLMAACFASRDSELLWGWFSLTVLGIFCIEVAKNAYGEIVDFDSGTDGMIKEEERSPFSGGKRVLVDGLLTKQETLAITAVFYIGAILIGVIIAAWKDSRVLIFCLPGLALAWYYHGGSVRLAYRGLGEAAVALAYGPLLILGAYFVQTTQLNALLFHLSTIYGLLVACFLLINEFPDRRADAASGKRNLVVILGPELASSAYIALATVAYCWLVLVVFINDASATVWPGLFGIFPALFAIRRLARYEGNPQTLVSAQAATLLSFCLMAVGSGIGYLTLS